MLGFLPGMSAQDAAQREIDAGQLKDDGTGIKKGKYNWQDHIGGFFGGYNQQDVESAAQLLRDEKLQKVYDAKYGNTGSELIGSGQDKTYAGVTGKTEVQLNNEVELDKARLAVMQLGQGTENFDPSKLGSNATPTQIRQAIRGTLDTNKTTAKGEEKAEVLRKEGRADDLLMMQMLQNNRQSDRQFQLQQAQQNYQNRALDLKEARMDRRDRQAAIQQMMAGLSQLGASIAI
jgi:hypothetical protein